MFERFKRKTLSFQYASLAVFVVAVTAWTVSVVAEDVSVYARVNEARTVADMVENVGTWASRYKGVWVRDDKTEANFDVGDFLNEEAIAPKEPTGKPITYHQKNPALIQRELSQVTEKSFSKAKFRMTSDKYMNPNNKPTGFERTALEQIRSNKSKEYYEVKSDELLYGRAIIAGVGCMKCHDTPENAPKAVREKYPALVGYGYKVGETIGVISVTVPLSGVINSVTENTSSKSWWALTLFAGMFLVIFYLIRKMLIQPLRVLKDFADSVRDAEIEDKVKAPKFVTDEHGSANEIHQLSHSIKAVKESLTILNQFKSRK